MSHHLFLGRHAPQPTTYSPDLLYPIPRLLGRRGASLDVAAVSCGADVWTAYEMSWLSARGVPQVAVLQFVIDATSVCIIESKSLKLYLNAFADTVFASPDAVLDTVTRDICAAAEGTCRASWITSEGPSTVLTPLAGTCIDETPIDSPSFVRDPGLLVCGEGQIEERLTSNLLKNNCPVTQQPDWASLMVHYIGPAIDRARLLRYILSYRCHTGFHELCVEQIFADIWARCAPSQLTVYARYTRRGGLDINPFRSTFENVPQNLRTFRQ